MLMMRAEKNIDVLSLYSMYVVTISFKYFIVILYLS